MTFWPPHTHGHIYRKRYIYKQKHAHIQRVPITTQRSNEIVTPRFLIRETKIICNHSYF